MDGYERKKADLKKQLEQYAHNDIVVAFSGGVDSGLLLRMACDGAKKTGKKVYGIMLHTMLHPSGEVKSASAAAEETGAEFKVLEIDELQGAGIEDNPTDRCYRCKRYLFQKILEESKKLGAEHILEGTNEDDLYVYRPGIRAVRELGIISPLADAGLKKEDVRRLAKEYEILSADKPSMPCLATRFPYGTHLSYEEMRKVETAEEWLRDRGFYNVRLRIHGDTVRIEVDCDAIEKVIQYREEIVKTLKKSGYEYITLDLEGFRSGSMDYMIRRT